MIPNRNISPNHWDPSNFPKYPSTCNNENFDILFALRIYSNARQYYKCLFYASLYTSWLRWDPGCHFSALFSNELKPKGNIYPNGDHSYKLSPSNNNIIPYGYISALTCIKYVFSQAHFRDYLDSYRLCTCLLRVLCIYIHLPISTRVASLTLWQSFHRKLSHTS